MFFNHVYFPDCMDEKWKEVVMLDAVVSHVHSIEQLDTTQSIDLFARSPDKQFDQHTVLLDCVVEISGDSGQMIHVAILKHS
jgi:hypothetical protein